MSPFTVDFSNVDEFEPIPASAYTVTVSKMTESEEDGPSGYPYVTCEMTVTEGEFENRKLFSNLSLSPRAAFKIKEFLIACGVPEEELKAEDFEFDPEEYEGTVLEVAVAIKNVDGVLRNSITNFLAPDAEVPRKKSGGAAPKGRKIR